MKLENNFKNTTNSDFPLSVRGIILFISTLILIFPMLGYSKTN